MKTFVRFVVFKDEILAVFMRGSAARRFAIFADNGRGAWVRQCYARVGQHSECYDGMQKRKRATPDQYNDLKQELETIGYDDLVVM